MNTTYRAAPHRRWTTPPAVTAIGAWRRVGTPRAAAVYDVCVPSWARSTRRALWLIVNGTLGVPFSALWTSRELSSRMRRDAFVESP